MDKPSHLQVSRRERQIMEIIYSHGEASVSDVLEAMHDPPSYSAVRAMLRILEEKGHLRHKRDGRKYVYLPTVTPAKARRSAMRNLLQTFDNGSLINSEFVLQLQQCDDNRGCILHLKMPGQCR